MSDDFDLYDPDEMEEPIDFNEVMDAFLDDENTFPPRFLTRLSGLESLELDQFIDTWPNASQMRRERLLEDLEVLADDLLHLDFDQIFRLGLNEASAHARQVAIRALWECPDTDLIEKFTALLLDDPETDVRAQAARGLGRFIYWAEIEEINPALSGKITEQLLSVFKADPPEALQRGILEGIGFGSDPKATKLIESAFDREQEDWLVSGLIAAGRSANEQFIPQVIEHLNHDSPDVRREAVEASGLLSAQQAATHLLHLIDDPEDEIKFAAIWALSEIGGLDARAALESLIKNAEDEDEVEFIADALENLDFTEMSLNFDLLDLSEDEFSEDDLLEDDLTDLMDDTDDY
ncbi:MAG: HEAT repeat domain-containing protein [Anaerolineales bacterium]